ncbi:hypothetical protein PF010_g22393 [Phytophthora fragariae]|uniref:Uncharacterized protein n=1 Tax=Phytophthora fragariae TaxID=53985 RepID=A0A6G0K9H5_9STRA|nr:hypothetical protein PF010_g22393 [Phytophthora fragariae]
MASATPSVEKSESAAVVLSLSESPAPSVKAAKAKKSKTNKVKAVVAAVAATQALEEADNLGNLSLDHPYLSVLYKRLRSHRKKLEKIKSLEAGDKQLNAQQLQLMGNKATLEKLVAELEMLREQFVGVFSQELEQKKQQQEEKDVAAAAEEIEAVEQVQEKEQEEQVAEQQEAAPKQVQEHQETLEKAEQKEDFADVYELLKTLHVVNLHQALGKEVPMVLDFFSKVLLGNTRPPAELSYEENLMESLEEAKKYLTDSDKVFACDTTYSGLRAFVAQLTSESSGKREEEQEEVAEEEEEVVQEPVETVEEVVVEVVPDVPVVPAEINTMPEISFFTESQLESEQCDDSATAVEDNEVIEAQEEVTEAVASDILIEEAEEIIKQDGVEIEEQVEVAVEPMPPVPESVSAPPLSFAAVTAGVSSERTPSPSGSSEHEKKEGGSEENSPGGKNTQRRRGQGRRWKEKGEKGSNSNNGDKSADGSPTNGSKPRRPRAPRTTDENSGAQSGKNNKFKEGRRSRVERGLRKQNSNSQQYAARMIAPHA